MKRARGLFQNICSLENLMEAHLQARKKKSHYSDVIMVNKEPQKYLGFIRKMLLEKTYSVSPYETQTIMDNGKERVLYKLPYYPDRIIQWAILLQAESVFINSMIPFTCSSIKGRGNQLASRYLCEYINSPGSQYCLKADIRKYYDNIDHDILKEILMKKFKDHELLWLFFKIIDSFPKAVGIPIGSYTSQFFANYYLNEFDHWIKDILRMKYYVRYMDDIVILHESKEVLHKLREDASQFLAAKLKLEFKDNWQVFPVAIRGVDYVGFRHFPRYKLLRKRIADNLKRKLISVREHMENGTMTDNDYRSAQSYKGWLVNCDCCRLMTKYYNPLIDGLEEYRKYYLDKMTEEDLQEMSGENTLDDSEYYGDPSKYID